MTVNPATTPFEALRVPGLDDNETETLNRLLQQLAARAERNLLRASYYDGKRAIRQVGTVIPPHYYKLGIVLGWSAKAVDILARRCNLNGFVWPDGDLDSLGYGDLWEDNFLGAEISSAILSSLIHGPAFLINTAGEADEPDALIHVRDAMNTTGEWNGRTRRLNNLLSIHTRGETGQPTAFALYLRNLTIVATYDRIGGWTVERTPHRYGVPAEALVYKPRAGRPLGSSRISRPVMALHDQALRTVIRMEGHMDVYSFPEMWLLGADEAVFKNPDGTQKAAWQVMLGRIKAIPDDEDAAEPRADVKQFSAQSPEPHIMALKQQAQLFSGETSIPLSSLGVSDMSNPTSADSYIASREDIIAEAEGAVDDWSPPLRRAVVRGLAMLNNEPELPDGWKTIEPKWRSPVYLSKAAEADAGAKQLGAVPWLAETSVGLELLGLTQLQAKQALAERSRVTGSTALQAIVAAAQTGRPVVTDTINPPPPDDAVPG